MSYLRKTIVVGALLALLLPVAGIAAEADRWIHVRVQDGSDTNVAVNLPLSVIGPAMDVIPEHVRNLEIDGTDLSMKDIRAMWAELRNHPNDELVKVDEPDQKVTISLSGNYLQVDASGEENVQVRIPTAVVDALFSGDGDQLAIGKALEVLSTSGAQELVTVTGSDENVRIWVDSSSSGEAGK